MVALAPAPPNVHPEPGDLHADLAGDRLTVPREVLEALSPQRLRSAEELYSYLSSFPTACAALFHWSVSDCLRAASHLHSTLSAGGYSLPTPPEKQPGMGALDPDRLGRKR